MFHKTMSLLLVAVLSVVILALLPGCDTAVQGITIDQLFADQDKYNGEQVIIEGFYFHGWEVIILCERLEYSGYAEGQLTPDGQCLWIEGGIPKEVYDKLYQQDMMGPQERYGKVRIKGKFEYGAQYGHLGAYSSQIVPSEVELLPWATPNK
jgi:hypothetical protein